MGQIYSPNLEFKVFVRCMTYNHAKYIEDTLNGFAMQKTDFPFVCLVMDDCSTDGEQEVIKAWMERECDMEKVEYVEIELSNIIIVPHKSNGSCIFAFYMLKQNLYHTDKKKIMLQPWRDKCGYEALCEGDDYWTDSLKLQNQVDFLEQNKEYGLIFTNYVFLYESTQQIMPSVLEQEIKKIEDLSVPIFPNILLIGDSIKLCTVMIRSEIYRTILCNNTFLFSNYFPMGDTQTFFCVGEISKIKYLDKRTVVYRKHKLSATNQGSKEKDTLFFIRGSELRMYMNNREKFAPVYEKSIKKRYEYAVLKSILYDIPIMNFDVEVSLKTKILKKVLYNNTIKKIIRRLVDNL